MRQENGYLFWSNLVCNGMLLCILTKKRNFTTEFSAVDRISALEVKLENVDSLISESQSLKLEVISLKKPEYPYLRAAFRNRTDSTASDCKSKKRKAEGNQNLQADKEPQNKKAKFSRRAQIFTIRRQSVKLKYHAKDGIFTLVFYATLSLWKILEIIVRTIELIYCVSVKNPGKNIV